MKIEIHAKPGGRVDAIGRAADGGLVVRVRAVADKGEANAAIEKVLADALGIPRASVRVLTPRMKRKLVEIDADAVAVERLGR